jgi:tRNA threonylcarbamoyladenosine biosynthesis protein TsaE
MDLPVEVTTHSVEQTAHLGATLGRLLDAGDVICLSGDLGAGKTALAAGIGAGWGALERVISPTFVIVREHRRSMDSMRLFHLDCYRLTSIDDAETIGLSDMLIGDDVVLIEWAERVAELLPAERLVIRLEQVSEPTSDQISEESENSRRITLVPHGARYETLVADLLKVHP